MVVYQKPSAPFWDLHRVMLRKLRAGAVGAAAFCRFNALEVSKGGSRILTPAHLGSCILWVAPDLEGRW